MDHRFPRPVPPLALGLGVVEAHFCESKISTPPTSPKCERSKVTNLTSALSELVKAVDLVMLWLFVIVSMNKQATFLNNEQHGCFSCWLRGTRYLLASCERLAPIVVGRAAADIGHLLLCLEWGMLDWI